MAQLKSTNILGNLSVTGKVSGDGANLTNLNASNIADGTLNADRLPNSGVTASSYGPSGNASPAHSGSFSVPYFTVDAHGRITAASTKTITLPADNNTDTKVTQTITNLNASYPLLLAPSGQTATATTTAYFDSGITLNPSTNIITGAKLEYNYTTSAPTQPDAVIKIGSNNYDVNIFKVFDYATGYKASGGGYGYSLMYNGTGEGIGNALTLYCDNQGNATKVIGWQLNQSGQMGIKTSANSSYSLVVSGASYFDGATTVNNTLTVNGAFTTKGNATLGDATSDAHKVNGNITFNGTAYLANGTTYKLDNSGNANLKVANAEALQLDNKAKFVYNSTDKCVDLIFI